MPRPLVLIAACLVAALAAGISGAVVFSVLLTTIGGVAGDPVSGALVFVFIITIFGAIATTVLGLPAHALLVRVQRTGLMSYATAGLVAGALVSALFASADDRWILVAGLVAGMSGATAFWLVARPDRLAAGKPVQS